MIWLDGSEHKQERKTIILSDFAAIIEHKDGTTHPNEIDAVEACSHCFPGEPGRDTEDEEYLGILLKIHDLPIKHPMGGASFHVNKDHIDRIWWDGKILQVITVKGEVWQMDFEDDQWKLVERLK